MYFQKNIIRNLFLSFFTLRLKFPDDRKISDPLKDLFKKMMEKDPSKRITIKFKIKLIEFFP